MCAIIIIPEAPTVAKKRITVTVDADIAEYLYEMPNTSAVVSEAIREYRTRQLEKELEAAYSMDAMVEGTTRLWGEVLEP